MLILGSGPIRIGQGIEFDYCTVHAVKALREEHVEVHIVNNNPETVSTDFDTSDRLFFEPMALEDIMNILEKDHYSGVMVQFGGQNAVNLAVPIHQELLTRGMSTRILGTSPDSMDIAEDRDRFSELLRKLDIPSPPNSSAYSLEEARTKAASIGYPILVRPSYVLGGRAMEIVHDEIELESYMKEAVRVSRNHPVLIDSFLQNAIELDIDAVCDGEEVLIGGIMEHIEEAGVHSGDSACVIPTQSLSPAVIGKVKDYTARIALGIGVIGLVNLQMAVKGETVFILEANPRASRTVPFVSKATGVPLAKIAAKVMIGKKLKDLGIEEPRICHTAVKEVLLPFNKLPGVDTVLGPEMKSTGEVMGIDYDFGRAYYKACISADNELPVRGNIFISVISEQKDEVIPICPETPVPRPCPLRDFRDRGLPVTGRGRRPPHPEGAGRLPERDRPLAKGRDPVDHQHPLRQAVPAGPLPDHAGGCRLRGPLYHHGPGSTGCSARHRGDQEGTDHDRAAGALPCSKIIFLLKNGGTPGSISPGILPEACKILPVPQLPPGSAVIDRLPRVWRDHDLISAHHQPIVPLSRVGFW